MARNKGTFQFAANFEVKAAAALDPRVAVATKAELIAKETWPYDGDTIYLYKGILVSVQEENAIYMLTDINKILSADYSGWLRVDAGNAEQVEVVDNLESDATDKALSAKQGKVLMGEITDIKGKITAIYTPKGSKDKYEDLPTDAKVGDVWNVVEAYNGHPAGTNYAWTGTEWDALGGIVDLSNYFNKSEVNAAIKVETDRATAEEARLAGLIGDNTTLATEAKNLATGNQSALSSLSQTVGDINLILNGNDDPDDEIEDAIGLIGRLTAVEDLIGQPTAEDKEKTMLTRLSALEELVTGGEGGEEGDGDQTLLQRVNQNTLDITALELVVGDSNSGLVKAVNTLNANAQTEGSVDYKIEQAFKWIDVE
jgi:hypothetical protein